MLIKRAATLQLTLALKEIPANGSAWHRLILQGLPFGALQSAAEKLGVKESDLAAHLGLNGAQLATRRKSRKLQAAESDVLYAIALAYVRLAGFKGVAQARAWLMTPSVEIKGAVPVDLLRSRIGTEYVNTAIERMRPAPVVAKTVEDNEGEEEPEIG